MAKQQSFQEEQVNKYAPLVKRIAYHMMARLPASVEVDDLIQVGLIGLMDAVSRFDGTQGAQFESYATQRIRGAMLDELREADWLPRHVRQKSRQIETAIHSLQQRLGKPPTEQEISKEMGIPIDQYQGMLNDVKGSQLLYYEDFSDDDSANFLERYLVRWQQRPARGARGRGLQCRPGCQAIHHLARARTQHDGHVLRTGHEPEGNRRGAGGVGVACVPAALASRRAAAGATQNLERLITCVLP
jgi:RNA polymerase sigma factor FliA